MRNQLYLTDDGNQWERRVNSWLHLRYRGGQYEEVPAEHKGDFGIEGFSRDGIAYQCYAPRGPLKVKELYENQRKKITDDISKFVTRKVDLAKLFGKLKIGSWWLVVPEHRSAKLVQHATEKAELVRSKALSYVKVGFFIHIATPEDFATERQAAIVKGLEALQLEESEVALAEVKDWADKNDQFVQILDRKIQAYSGETRKTKISDLRDQWIERFIASENTLNKMQIASPDIWEEFRALKNRKEKALFTKYSINAAASDVLLGTLDQLRQDILARLPNLDPARAEELSMGTVAEWLHQCPLDFPDGTKTEQ